MNTRIEIVAHSKGNAYAKGLLDGIKPFLAANHKFGNFYIIAPENAKGHPTSQEQPYRLDVSDYESVFQYGSNFEQELKCHQDGVAPQVRINGLGEGLNVFIPMKKLKNPDTDKLEDIRRFSKAHSIDNFYWLFTEPLSIGRIRKRNN